MHSLALRALLGSIVAAAAGASACTLISKDDPACPHTVVDKSSVKDVPPATACSVLASIFSSSGAPNNICSRTCGDSTVNDCQLPDAYVTAFRAANPNAYAADAGQPVCPTTTGPTVALTCQEIHNEGTYHSSCPIDGRRPAGLEAVLVADAPAVGRYFAGCAHLEAASVFAFRVLHRELRAHEAPRDLVRRAGRAAAEEVRHAAIMTELAARFGATALAARVTSRPVHPVFEIALENAVEGLVRETFAAAVALFRAENASDAHVRAAMRAIAEDECGHAAFSADLDAWARARLDARENTRLDAAMRAAIEDLAAEFAHEPEPEVRRVAGAPSAAQAKRILGMLARDLLGGPGRVVFGHGHGQVWEGEARSG